ncbi:non-ribosomal peptide synthetase [Pseudoalteromonas viridis]|uniref:Amino acid adenylation domain-containing protein n=1 Tax=Pseudoalteromonas viridis TaxID=339617 RepID=A0ABX7VAH5_9GAMM|nr:non-ribosomal peptide synthetase [Pseudoalteromonas viridis]QTL36672.1 amino acid adenylation domain-containing protein [Pseudoalteromonas viridis]
MQNKIEAVYPLTPLQEGLLFHTVSNPDESAYHEQVSCTIEGQLDVEKFKSAWQFLSDRHSVLRSVFAWKKSENPVQAVAREMEIEFNVLTVPQESTPESYWQQVLADDMDRGFELSKAPLTRFFLLQVDQQSWKFLWSHHHILLDGWSFGILMREFLESYEHLCVKGQLPELKPALQFKEFVHHLSRQNVNDSQAYWQRQLQGFATPSHLSIDKGVGIEEGGEEEYTLDTLVNKAASAKLHAWSKQSGVTLSTIVHAAWAKILASYCCSQDVLFGSTIAGRPPEISGIDEMVGICINTIPFRVQIPEQGTVSHWLTALHQQALDNQMNQRFSLSDLHGYTDLSASQPLFESILSVQNYPLDDGMEATWGGIQMKDFLWKGPTNYPLTVRAFPNEEIMLVISYYKKRFETERAEALLAQLKGVIEQIAEHLESPVSALQVIHGQEAQTMLFDWNESGIEFPEQYCLHQLFEQHAAKTPEKLALIAGDGSLSYAQLDQQANQLAHYLQSQGVKLGDKVGICVSRSTLSVTAMLAILKAGACYVPLDPAYPEERLQYMLQDSGVNVILLGGRGSQINIHWGIKTVVLEQGEWRAQSSQALDIEVDPELLCYMIYTSGSSGQPKGVMLNHRGRVNNIFDYIRRYNMGPSDRLMSVSSLSFDISVANLFGMLMSGGTLVYPKYELEKDVSHWLDVMLEHKTTIWHSAPALMEMILDNEKDRLSAVPLRLGIFGGDWISTTLPDRLRAVIPALHFVSAGGATELSIDSVIYDVHHTDPDWISIPYGKVMDNQSVYILDENLDAVPIGVPGELHLGGIGMAAGYFDRPGLTAEKYVPNPYARVPGERLYKTGDLAKYHDDGTVELLGRIDFQVKIRGLRVELGEIESTLKQHAYVQDAVAWVQRDEKADATLVAYVVLNQTDMPDLRGWLMDKLPEHMVPLIIAPLAEIPLTPNGKTDRRALPKLELVIQDEAIAAQSDVEQQIINHWAELLGLEAHKIGRQHNFFDIGGNSLKALKGANIPGLKCSVADLYRYSSVQDLATHIERGEVKDLYWVELTQNKSTDLPVLLCVPYGGGHAGVYQRLAEVLEGHVRLLSLSLPGHENHDSRPLMQAREIVAGAVTELKENYPTTNLFVYGHCGGVATALELATQLELQAFGLQHVWMAASYPLPATQIAQDPFVDMSDLQLAMEFAALGAFEQMDDKALIRIGRLLRHDGSVARNYFLERYRNQSSKLAAPLTCLIGADDPLTLDYEEKYLNWQSFAHSVSLAVVPGGHYFNAESAEQLAASVLPVLGSIEQSSGGTCV